MAWSEVGATYDEVAGDYEARFVHELDGKPRDRDLLGAFAGSTLEPVVEVGCGPGQIGARVRQRGRAVVGLDMSGAMAALAARRLDAATVADMRALPLASGLVGGLLAFYSLIHVRRSELRPVLREFARVLRPGGRVLLSAHEGSGEVELSEFVGHQVDFIATLFQLEELTDAVSGAGLDIVLAERRSPYPTESETYRLYVEAIRPG